MTDTKWKRTLYEHGGSRIFVEKDGGGKKLIADTYQPEEISHRLFAAPELYAELEMMVETFHGYQGMEMARARAALAKARGETS